MGDDRDQIARKRLVSVLEKHVVASARTLEQKISDAGPFNQRIDPHVLTGVRNALVKEGRLVRVNHDNTPWFSLGNMAAERIQARLQEQQPIVQAIQAGNMPKRVGMALEIAIYRALCAQDRLEFLGGFADLDEHDDSTLYSKIEPPGLLSGKRLPGSQKLDFLVRHPEAGWGGIEAKNVREWQYPDRDEITELLFKAVTLDCIPILIARRIPFVTFKVFSTCGVIFHQTYNQLFPATAADIAEQARNKKLLGLHDIRTGNQPDARMTKFISENLPKIMPEAREKFEWYKDLLAAFASHEIAYPEFAARVRRRSLGQNEDGDWPDDQPDYDPNEY